MRSVKPVCMSGVDVNVAFRRRAEVASRVAVKCQCRKPVSNGQGRVGSVSIADLARSVNIALKLFELGVWTSKSDDDVKEVDDEVREWLYADVGARRLSRARSVVVDLPKTPTSPQFCKLNAAQFSSVLDSQANPGKWTHYSSNC
ncbi:hypothetical protein GOP47_0029429 [Adiantum capillus-veneris]|nr:hypothetical protein GOP47_0029429 [Adiantum capillus-veneris]